ncbi:MAG: hypothetical protein H7259_04405 [Cytophagales bacterium]|nr:hypothetical protein [Cytophaga sp.]
MLKNRHHGPHGGADRDNRGHHGDRTKIMESKLHFDKEHSATLQQLREQHVKTNGDLFKKIQEIKKQQFVLLTKERASWLQRQIHCQHLPAAIISNWTKSL